MNNLTREETVWLQAVCAAISAVSNASGKKLETVADSTLDAFKDRFPASPPPQNESVSELAQEEQRNKDFNACIRALADVPSQDNEGYQPDRGSFKTGWFAALRYVRGEE